MKKKSKKEICKHMEALIEYCKATGVKYGGCGDCGSPWLTCEKCGLTVNDADNYLNETF